MTVETSNDSQMLTTSQVAAELGVPVREVRKMISLGLLRSRRVGRAIRVSRHAVREFVEGGDSVSPAS